MPSDLHEEMKEGLLEQDNLNDMFEILDEYYDLDTPIGKITKKLIVSKLMKNIEKIVKVARIPERPEPEEEEETEEEEEVVDEE